jgi:hypothetical protein
VVTKRPVDFESPTARFAGSDTGRSSKSGATLLGKRMSPEMALNGHVHHAGECSLMGERRASLASRVNDVA